jgi:hypothetical protein
MRSLLVTVARISKRAMDSFGPAAKPYIVFDRDLTGFGLRVMPSGAKTWIVEYRPGAGGRKIFKRRMKIDLATRMTPDEARAQAKEILARVRLGEDPAAARTTSRQTPTIAAFTNQFLDEYARPPNIKPNTRRPTGELSDALLQCEEAHAEHVARFVSSPLFPLGHCVPSIR